MQYALVDNVRKEAFPGGRAVCPTCASEMIAKCGIRIIPHWAHYRKRNCDPWWENETQWHRDWKNVFPEHCREISHIAPNGEIHRADIKAPGGIYVEIQHSAISDEERLSRELFYQNLIWIVDGRKFIKNFDIFHRLPHPKSELAKDLVWYKAARGEAGSSRGLFWRKSENPNARNGAREMVYVHGIDEIIKELSESYRGHHQYDWIKPRKTWLSATCPVFLDFGESYLVKLEIYDSYLPCIQLISKNKFIRNVSNESLASSIGENIFQEKFFPKKETYD